jgi:hypothetical protein
MVRYRLLIVSYEAIYVRDPSTSSAGRCYKSSGNMSCLAILVSSPTAFHVLISEDYDGFDLRRRLLVAVGLTDVDDYLLQR